MSFSLDKNGILTVKAKDKDTGKENKIEIKGSSGLNPEEVERMRKDAEAHADEDRKKVELINARNEADQLMFTIEKQLKEHGDKMSESDKSAIQAAVEKTKQACSRDDVAAIKQAGSDLAQAAQALAQYMQGGAGAGPRPSGEAGPGGKDDVMDAEFEVKK